MSVRHSTRTYQFRLINMTGTTEEWAESDHILESGELGYDETLKIVKMGDGVHLWTDPALKEFGRVELDPEDVAEIVEDVIVALDPDVDLTLLFENALA